MIKINDQYFWNVLFIILFFLFVITATIILETESKIAFSELRFFDYVLITLATWRLTRLFTHDHITKFIREQFWDYVTVGENIELEKPKFGLRRTIADLLSCPWCLSVWWAALVVFFYLMTPYAFYPVLILAISAVATFFYITANLVGLKAEQLRLENEGKSGER